MSTLSERISQALGADIVSGKVAPGTKLDEETLARRFKVSRSPVRDALRHLAATRLVESEPRRGFSVAAIDVAGLHDMFEAVAELEALCARFCALRAGAPERKTIEAIHRQALGAAKGKDLGGYSRLNEAFHRAIYSAARNRNLEALTLELRQRLAPFRTRVFFDVADRMRSSSQEHDLLAQAIVRGDADAASHAMRSHAASAAANVMEYFRRHDMALGAPSKRVYKNGAAVHKAPVR
ncbi:MAG TPA: GntR family transcriptional regulator [Burkholderiales bacterium]|jgi:DNA-binding GntR family transcriptional regulator|nr:GntR family transcriptional regulator [Burkholderiales bacterium]